MRVRAQVLALAMVALQVLLAEAVQPLRTHLVTSPGPGSCAMAERLGSTAEVAPTSPPISPVLQ